MKYLSVEETAKKWNISNRSVRNYCANNRIDGTVLQGKIWMIPSNATKPTRKKRISNTCSNLLDILKKEKELSLKGGIYHKTQVLLAYNSNHIEGSKLTSDQTRLIYETNTIGISNTSINIDDITETINHFRCVDYIIDNANKKLNENIIKKLHYLLKYNTSDSKKSWFNVGEYKSLENEVGGYETTPAIKVKEEITKLLNNYNNKDNITIDDIVDSHYKFEKIHPFQDGNGRVGRLIMFKECLKHNITPFIIEDVNKNYYYRGLIEYVDNKGYLLETCLASQDTFKKYLDYFKIKYKD